MHLTQAFPCMHREATLHSMDEPKVDFRYSIEYNAKGMKEEKPAKGRVAVKSYHRHPVGFQVAGKQISRI